MGELEKLNHNNLYIFLGSLRLEMVEQLLGGVEERVGRREYDDLVPADHAILTSEQRSLLGSLGNYEIPDYLEERLLAKGGFDSREGVREAFKEWKKYVALNEIKGRRISMMSEKVDEVWHQFILFTRQYHSFCDNFLSGYFHHSPHTSETSREKKREGAIRFVKSYQQVFGKVSGIWGSSQECEEGCWDNNCDTDCDAGSNCD
jgi:hypothetical protein